MNVDQIIVIIYLIAIVIFGCKFIFLHRNSEEFMSAGKSIPGWALGLSIFGSYISTLSFLGNPAAAYMSNWNLLVSSFASPLGAIAATLFFIPFYRHNGEISAYQHLERRFGAWARIYGVICFLLLQIVRLGMITQLLASVMAPLFAWDTNLMIVFLGTVIIVYPLLGGTESVIWVGVIQSLILILGIIICLYFIMIGIPGGITEVINTGLVVNEQGMWGKFSLGPFQFNLFIASFWVVLLQGLNEHIRNFAIDQSYVQRYITAKTDKDAMRGVWYGILLYIPIAVIFFFIGTALYVYTKVHSNWLPLVDPDNLAHSFPEKKVFQYFINTMLPTGLRGLVIAAIASAAMDSNLNSMATLFLKDVYQRYWNPLCSEWQSMAALRISTLLFGVVSIIFALFSAQLPGVLDTWFLWGGIASGGILGLFLLGMLCPKTNSQHAGIAVITGILVMLLMTITLPDVLGTSIVNPVHKLLIPCIGTVVIFIIGSVLGWLFGNNTNQFLLNTR